VREAPSAARLRPRSAAPLEGSDYRERIPPPGFLPHRRFPRRIIGDRDCLPSRHMRG